MKIEYQEKLLADDSPIIMAFWERVTGKSIISAKLAVDAALAHEGARILVFGRSQQLAMITKDYAKTMLVSTAESHDTFYLSNNSQIKFLSIQSRSWAGHEADLVILDDIPLWENLIGSRLVESIMPILAPRNGRIVIFADLEGLSIHYAKTSDNPLLQKKEE